MEVTTIFEVHVSDPVPGIVKQKDFSRLTMNLEGAFENLSTLNRFLSKLVEKDQTRWAIETKWIEEGAIMLYFSTPGEVTTYTYVRIRPVLNVDQ